MIYDENKGDDGDRPIDIDHHRVKYTVRYDDGREEEVFNHELALASLLLQERVFIGDHTSNEDWSDDARQTISIYVWCNGVFEWGALTQRSYTSMN